MMRYEQTRFTGERALFQGYNLEIAYCTFAEGESPLKEGNHLNITDSMFQWKYPLWYCNHVKVVNSTMFEMARAGIWYTNDIVMKDTTIQAPKAFRRCSGVVLEQVTMTDAAETLWNCQNIRMKQVTAKGDYFAMSIQDAEISDFTLVGNYSFEGAKNLTIRNARMLSKDAFWNCENIIVYDSFISGAYFGWNAKNVTLINCTVESLQGFCYMENLVLKNCKLLNTNLAFEYSTVDVEVTTRIDSVKNPIAGRIQAEEIGELIFDAPEISKENTKIITMKGTIEGAVNK